jgi:hypothetical protein
MLTNPLFYSGLIWRRGKNRLAGGGERGDRLEMRKDNCPRTIEHSSVGGEWANKRTQAYGFLLKVYKNNPSLEKVSLSSVSISSTTNLFLALFMNCISARLRFLKQKYITASLHKSRRSPNVLRSSGNAGSKYTQSAARITSGFSLTTSAGNGLPLFSC